MQGQESNMDTLLWIESASLGQIPTSLLDKQVKSWPTDAVVLCSRPAGGGNLFKRHPLHTALHYYMYSQTCLCGHLY